MKTVYVNKEGVICACTVEVPEFHPHPCEYMPGINDCPMCLGYDQALIECKEAVVPFEDSGKALMLLYRETKTDYKINASYGEWANNYLKEDTFYQIEADWEIVGIDCGEKYEDFRCLKCGADPFHRDTCKKVARLKVPAPTVATDNSGDNFEKEKREAKEWELWRDFLYEVGKQRHYLHGEVWEDTEWEKLMEILKKDFIITRKS